MMLYSTGQFPSTWTLHLPRSLLHIQTFLLISVFNLKYSKGIPFPEQFQSSCDSHIFVCVKRIHCLSFEMRKSKADRHYFFRSSFGHAYLHHRFRCVPGLTQEIFPNNSPNYFRSVSFYCFFLMTLLMLKYVTCTSRFVNIPPHPNISTCLGAIHMYSPVQSLDWFPLVLMLIITRLFLVQYACGLRRKELCVGWVPNPTTENISPNSYRLSGCILKVLVLYQVHFAVDWKVHSLTYKSQSFKSNIRQYDRSEDKVTNWL